jgi:zinc/manganese transport system substrate-binding protein
VQTLNKYMALCCAIMICLTGSALADTENRPIILATTTDLADITKTIVGGLASVSSISSGGEDPHFLAARPAYIVRARDADAWIRVGLELEVGWEGPILRDSRNRKIQEGEPGHIDASTDVLLMDVPQQRVTRDMGDVHPDGNPHYWLDPLNGRIMARTIAIRLGALFPGHASTFEENFKSFEHRLDVAMFGPQLVEHYGGDHLWQLLLEEKPLPEPEAEDRKTTGWYGLMKPHQGSAIVTYHRSWGYLANRFGLEIPVELEPKPGVPPSSKHLAGVVEAVRADQVRVVLQEPFYSRKAADLVARNTGAHVVVCPNTVGGSKDAASYLELMDHIIQSLAAALEKEK